MESIPKRHKAIIYSKPGTLATEIIEVDTPEPQHVSMTLKTASTHSGVCHSDYGFIMNSYSWSEDTPIGQIGGHEGVGVVVKLGPHVTDVQLGNRVGIKWITSACLICDACNAGYDNKCQKRSVAGLKTPGTFQQYMVTDPKYATPIPDEVSSAAAAPLLCGGVTVWAALKEADCKLGDWVAISGAGGGLGHLALQYAKAFGLRVIAIDHGSKESFCKGLGADKFFDFMKYDTTSLTAELKEVTKGGSHAVLVCSSSTPAYDQALGFLRYSGTLVTVGIPEGESHPLPQAMPATISANKWKIKGTVPGGRVMAIECFKPVALGLVRSQTTVLPMNKLSEAFDKMHRGEIQGRIVIDLAKEE